MPKPIFFKLHRRNPNTDLRSFYVDEKVHDAVLNRPVSSRLPEDFRYPPSGENQTGGSSSSRPVPTLRLGS
jgi:hypothetical protein